MAKTLIPANQALEVADHVIELMHVLGLIKGDYVFVGGSLCRGRELVGDVDICFVPSVPRETWDVTMSLIFNNIHEPLNTPIPIKPVQGVEILRAWMWSTQIDIWAAEDHYWGPMCMFVAGSGKLNVIQRVKASKQGITLSNKGLFNARTKSSYGPLYTERDVYELLGWPWLDYKQRDVK